MKKLLFLSVFALFALVSANVFGQSSGTKPAPGAKHNYSVTPNGTNKYLWTVTKGNLLVDGGSDVDISASTSSSTDITWKTSVKVGDWYYVHILETVDATGCSNEKVLPVQITESPFNLAIVAATPSQCYAGKVTVKLDNTTNPANPAITYDHGNAIIKFTVSPTGLSDSYMGYSFDLDIAYGTYTGLSQSVAFVVSSGSANISGKKVTVTNNNSVEITYTVVNANQFTNETDKDGKAADFTATATISNGVATNGVSDNTKGKYNDNTTVARPNTTGITTN